MKNRWIALSLFLFFIALGQYIWIQSDSKSTHLHSQLAPMGQSWIREARPIAISEFELFSLHNQSFQLVDLQGQWHILLFGYTSCPDVCPVTLRILTNALQELKQEGQKQVPRGIFISVDPERDTATHLANYVADIHKDLIGLTGTPSELKNLLHSLGSDYQIDKQEGEVNVNHPTTLFLIDPLGKFIGMFANPSQSAKLKEDIKHVLQEDRSET